MCEALKWTHLPVDGGLYDQHPQLLEEWRYIFAVRSEYERNEQSKRENEAKNKSRGSSGRGASRSRH